MVNILRYIRAVLWSFIGLGRRADMDDLQRKANPVALIATALVLAALLVMGLVALARLAVSALN